MRTPDLLPADRARLAKAVRDSCEGLDGSPVSGVVDADDKFGDLVGRQLPSTWAEVPAGVSGEDVAFAFIRAAYGAGYVRALEDVAA